MRKKPVPHIEQAPDPPLPSQERCIGNPPVPSRHIKRFVTYNVRLFPISAQKAFQGIRLQHCPVIVGTMKRDNSNIPMIFSHHDRLLPFQQHRNHPVHRHIQGVAGKAEVKEHPFAQKKPFKHGMLSLFCRKLPHPGTFPLICRAFQHSVVSLHLPGCNSFPGQCKLPPPPSVLLIPNPPAALEIAGSSGHCRILCGTLRVKPVIIPVLLQVDTSHLPLDQLIQKHRIFPVGQTSVKPQRPDGRPPEQLAADAGEGIPMPDVKPFLCFLPLCGLLPDTSASLLPFFQRTVHLLCVQFPIAAEHHVCLLLFCLPQHLFNQTWMDSIVAVQKKEIFSSCPLDSKVSCRRNAPVFLAANPDPVIRKSHFLTDLRPPVCGTVIHHEYFHVPERLAQHRTKAKSDVFFRIVHRNNDRYFFHTPRCYGPQAISALSFFFNFF